jgi:ATP-dependent exoDNAse (exonuclease V) beta subunit
MALDELSRRDELPHSLDKRDSGCWRAALAQLGLWGKALDEAQAAVERALDTTLAPDGEGRWVLSNRHQQPRSEWPLTRVDPDTGRVEDLVIDRSFVDASSGIRWLIDYKNSRPGPGETLEDFCVRQGQEYLGQLLRYRQALRELGREPVSCALYFTSVGRLYHMKQLDLRGRE